MLEAQPTHWGDVFLQSSALASVLADDLIASGLVPYACPCQFGPDNRYRLEELVSLSAKTLVYRAKDARLSDQGFHAEVAVKIFRPTTDSAHEAYTGRRITHPHVLRILDRGITDDGTPFVVSEFVDGGDLSQKSGPWNPKDAARFMVKLCRGVQAAHAAGVVHCDLKPANVILTKDGEPKLADFDLARSASNPSDVARGNVAFMAPEQYQCLENCLAPPADIYSLGGILYSLLTGRTPHGDAPAQIQSFHNQRLVIPSTGAGAMLDQIIRRAMHRDINQRYPSAAQMADDLEAWLAYRPIAWTRPSIWSRVALWSRRHPGGATAVVATSVLLGASLWAWSAILDRNYRRELAAQRSILRKADERVEVVRSTARAQLQSVISVLNPKNPAELDQRHLSTLTWIELLTSDSVFAPPDGVAALPARIAILQDAIAHAEADGRSADVDTMMKRYALVQQLVAEKRSVEAVPSLNTLEGWLASIPGDDSVHLTVRAMRACVDAEDARSARDANTRIASLLAIRAQAEDKPGMQRVVKIIDAVEKRITR